jgi:hypothetical protein
MKENHFTGIKNSKENKLFIKKSKYMKNLINNTKLSAPLIQ